jgi:hypothetical protein
VGNKFCRHASHFKTYVSITWHVPNDRLSYQQSLWSSNVGSHGLLHWHGQQSRWFAPLMAGLCVDHRRWTCVHF